ncbi:hypothetical protein, partial [Sphaerimonospora thailandensis]|uniref:hypothetical protein n=1 Tax=Sphaerimonospora thailandensis TaxID=795644 RepID=UPI001950169F
ALTGMLIDVGVHTPRRTRPIPDRPTRNPSITGAAGHVTYVSAELAVVPATVHIGHSLVVVDPEPDLVPDHWVTVISARLSCAAIA